MKKFWIKALLVIAALMFLATPCMAAEKVIKWKVQGFVPAGMLYHDTLVRMAEKVKKATGGRLVFEVHPAGALVPPFEGIKAVSQGAYQAQYSYSAMWVGKIPVSPLFTASPGGLNTLGMQMWLNEGGGAELWQEIYDDYGFNVKVLPAAPISMENFMWAKKTDPKIGGFQGSEDAYDALDGRCPSGTRIFSNLLSRRGNYAEPATRGPRCSRILHPCL